MVKGDKETSTRSLEQGLIKN